MTEFWAVSKPLDRLMAEGWTGSQARFALGIKAYRAGEPAYLSKHRLDALLDPIKVSAGIIEPLEKAFDTAP